MKHHETNQTSRQREQQFAWQVHGQTSLTASHDITSFVGQRRDVMRWPPACEIPCHGGKGGEGVENR